MQLLLSTARRTDVSRWICHSCRGIKQAVRESHDGYTSLSAASQELRKIGPARTRFAPSPTGYLHLGSLRTALFNYLVAKATGGQFLLRIEDTDQKRSVQGAEERLFEDLEWAGIEWDEGPKIGGPCGPYKQSERTALYREHAEQLLHSGNAYRCFCSLERLHALANHKSKLGLPPDYDRTCAHIPKEHSDDRAAKGEAHVVRLKAPDKYPVYNDLVYKLVKQRSNFQAKPPSELSFDDPILIKSDGFPTYHLANVVDDHLMKITHVIRGSEWMSSTPKHLAMYQAFGWEPPAFAHVGLLLDKDRQKLSKRTGSIDIKTWRDKGVFPEALTNFVALLGWSHGAGRDLMNLESLIRNASMKFTKGDSVVSFEKMWFLQKRHAGRYASLPSPEQPLKPAHNLIELAVKPLVKMANHRSASENLSFYNTIPEGQAREDYMKSILWVDAQNYTYPTEFINRNIYFFVAPGPSKLVNEIPSLKLRNVPSDVTHEIPTDAFLELFIGLYEIPPEKWNSAEIKTRVDWIIDHGASKSLQEVDEAFQETGVIIKKAWNKLVHNYLRWAISASKPGPDGAETMKILGQKETTTRLETAKTVIQGQAVAKF